MIISIDCEMISTGICILKTINHKPYLLAINKNHEFEELDGVKCAIVEKNASDARVAFLKDLLELNGYTVVITNSPPPKVATPVSPKQDPSSETPASAGAPENGVPVSDPLTEPPATYTIGVTDVTFNPTNAIFGRLLRTRDKKVVTLAYWQQKEEVANDEVPYFQRNK